MMKRLLNNKILICMLSLLFASWSLRAEEPDWTDYQAVLNHLQPGTKNQVSLTLVDYRALKADHSLLKAYQIISSFDPERLSSRHEKLAFYINVYNILAMKMVLDHWPLDSIKDAGSLFTPVWNKPAGIIAGEMVTLGQIEHKVLRPLADPRIHFAIVCASVSCPDLRSEPYTAAKLNEQLDNQVRQFLSNQNKGLRSEDHVIRISRIFDWFEEDFEKQGGVPAFVRHYRTDLPDWKIKANLAYDWSVNAADIN